MIYDRGILPPILFEESVGIFPIESVLATVEVKSTLKVGGLRSAYKSAKAIQAYRYLEGKARRENRTIRVGDPVIFALDSTLKKGDEIKIWWIISNDGKQLC